MYVQEEEEGWKMAPSSFVPAVNDATESYKGILQSIYRLH